VISYQKLLKTLELYALEKKALVKVEKPFISKVLNFIELFLNL